MAKNAWGDESAPPADGGKAEDPRSWGDRPAAQRDLPADVQPSGAGAGRGGVNPAAVQPSPSQEARLPIASEPRMIDGTTLPIAPVSSSVPTGNATFTIGSQPSTSSVFERTGQAFEGPPADPNESRQPAMVSAAPPQKQNRMAEAGRDAGDAGFLSRTLHKARTSAVEGVAGVVRAGAEAVGAQGVADWAKETAGAARDYQQALGEPQLPEGFGPKSPLPYLQSQAEGAGASLLNTASYATMLGPRAVIPMLSLQSAGAKYDEARNAGLDPAVALANAIPHGTFEALGERFQGLDKATKAVGVLLTKGAAPAARKTAADILVSAGVKEIPGELITYGGQTVVDLMPGVGIRQDMTVGQFLDGLRDTTVQAAMMGTAFGGSGVIARRRQQEPREPTAEELARRKGFLVQAERVKQLRSSGETAVADVLQRRLDAQQAEDELRSFGDKPWATDQDFQQRYREMRSRGVKPVEASARAAQEHGFAQLGAQVGLSEKAIAATIDAAAKKPLDEVPAYLERVMAQMAVRGIGQGLPEGVVAGAVGGLTDDAMNTAVDNMARILGADAPGTQAGSATQQPAGTAAAPQTAQSVPESGDFDPGNDVIVSPEADRVHQAATSPLNDLAEPTEAQKAAGNYKVGRLRIAGLDISVENPQGSTRRGVDADGNPWETPMRDHYGYVRGTTAADGDKLDVFIRPGTAPDYRGAVFVVDQVDPRTGKFDEHKVLIGPANEQEAEEMYRRNYSAGWKGLGAITRLPMPAFQAWARSRATKEPLGELAQVDAAAGPAAQQPTSTPSAATVPAAAGAPAQGQPAGNAAVGQADQTQQPHAALTELPEAQAQRQAFQQAEQRRRERAARLRSGAEERNPLMAFLGRHGLPLELAPEFAPGPTERRRAMVPGYGPIFRRGGVNIDVLAQRAVERGFLPPGQADANSLYELIAKAFRGERVAPLYAEGGADAEMARRAEAAAQDEAPTAQELDEQAAVAALSELADNELDVLEDLLDDVPALDASSDTSLKDAMRALGFTDKEIADATAEDEHAGAPAPGQGGGQPAEAAAGEARAADRGRKGAPPEEAVAPAAPPAETPAPAGVSASGLTWELRNNGTLAIKGDSARIIDKLAAAGIKKTMVMQGGIMVGKTQAQKAMAILEGRQEQKKPQPLSVGMTPADTQPVTVRDGVVFIGKSEAIDFDSGEPVRVPSDATEAQLRKALTDAGALSRRMKFFGGEAAGAGRVAAEDGAAYDGQDQLFPETDQVGYAAPYEADLFGEPIERREQARSDKPDVQGDAQPAAAVRREEAAEGDFYVETFVATPREQELGATRITTPAEAAQATKYLRQSAVERFDAIVTDADGRPLAVVGSFKGAATQTSVYPSTVIAEAIMVPGAARIWLSHNHPSGNPGLSRADEILHREFVKVFTGSGIELGGLLAIGKSRYGFTNEAGEDHHGDVPPPVRGPKVPVYERQLRDDRQYPILIAGPDGAKDVARQFYNKAKVPGLLLLDAQHAVAAWLPVNTKLLGPLRNTGGLTALYQAISRSNASSVIAVHGGELDAKVLKTNVSAAQNLGAAVKNIDLRMLDIINVKNKTSMAEQGLPLEAGPVYKRAGGQGGGDTGMSVDQARSIVAAMTSKWKNGPRVHVVETYRNLPGQHPADARGLYQAGNLYVVASAHPAGSKGREALSRTLAHEAIAHHGLREMLGRDGWSSLMKNVQLALKTGNKPLNRIRDHVRSTYVDEKGQYYLSQTLESDEIAALAVEQAIGENGEFQPGFGFLKSVYARIAQFLRDLGINIRFTLAELHGMLVLAQRNLQAGHRHEGGGELVVAAARSDKPVSVPDATVGHNLGAATSHPDYPAAKAGDVKAALRVARALVTPDLVAKVKAAIGDRTPLVLPVVAEEAAGRNKIPRAAAEMLAAELGLDTAEGIVQANRPQRTGMDGLDRIFAPVDFQGEVHPRNYLLLDDTLTQGGTFAALASHIEAGGGNVVGVVALTGKQYSAKIQPDPATLKALREKHGDLEDQFRAATGYGFDALTQSEARYLASYEPAQRLRDRIAEEGRRAGARAAAAPAQESVGRQAARWQEVRQTEYGPEFVGAQVQLLPLGQRDTESDLGENALPLGHAAHVQPGHKVYQYAIVADGAIVGDADLEVGPDGQIEAVHDIVVNDKRAGTGRAVMEAILASAAGPVRIIDIVPTAEAFWDKMGAGARDVYQNATTDWQAFQAARSQPRGQGQGAGAAARDQVRGAEEGAAPPAGPAEGFDAGVNARGSKAASDDIAARFKRETGDDIRVAGTKLAGIEVRNSMRAAGNKDGAPEPVPYTPAQLAMLEQWEAMQHPSSKYLFHTTPASNLESIAKRGLVVGSKPRFEGVSSAGRISLSANEAAARYYAGADDVMLRVKKGYAFDDLDADLLAGGDGVYTTGKNIPPEALEIKRGGKWVPLVEDGAFDAAAQARQVAPTEPELDLKDLPKPGPRLNRWRDKAGRVQFAPGQALYDLIGKAADPLLSRLQLKAASPELRRALRAMKVEVAKAQETAAAVAGEANKLTAAERAMVSDLVEKELDAGTVPPEHAVRLATLINDVMGKQTDELVRLGMLSEDSAETWRGQYLPRYYESKLTKKAADAWADAMRHVVGRPKAMRGIQGKHLRGRGLYETIPESQLAQYEAMGWQVRDPDYLPGLAAGPAEPPVPKGMTRLYHGSATHGRYSGKAWFSTDRKYAENYRSGAELQYIDYPTDKLNEIADPDGYGQTVEKGFTVNIELDSADVGVRKPLPVASRLSDGTVQVWRDFTRAEREKMGEIRDAGFRFVMGYMQTQRDIAMGRMFEALAKDPRMSARTQSDEFSVQVPDTKVPGTAARTYGRLAGRWVSKDTLSHLSAIEEAQSEALQLYRKGMSIWKEGKTALNPVSHVNNVLSNLTMAHFAGVSYWDAHKYAGAIADMAKGAPMVKEAKEAGLFLGTLSEAELMNMLPPELAALARRQESGGVKGARAVFNLMTFYLRKPMGWAYQAEDTFFRYLIYRDARAQGMQAQDAVDYAQRYIFTYDDLPKGARRIRDFAIPFFSYTYKATPALLHTALTHPLRFAAPASVLWAANAMAYALAVDEDDDWQEALRKYFTDADYRKKAKELEQLEREHLPPWMKGTTALLTPKTLRLGMDELTKLPVFIDMARIVPGGDLFDVSPNAGGLPIPQPMTPSHPLFTTAVAMLGNKDLFFGKEIVDNNDTRGEAAEKRIAWLWKQVTPAITAGNYHWQRGLNAIAQASGSEITFMPDVLGGDATGIGRDGLPVQPKYAAMQTFGIKARPIDIDRSEAIDQSMRTKMLRDIDAELRSLRRLHAIGAISDRAYDKAEDLAETKKDRIREGLTVDGEERP